MYNIVFCQFKIKDPSTSNGSTNGNTGAAGKAKNIQVSSPDQTKVVSNENNSKRRLGKVKLDIQYLISRLIVTAKISWIQTFYSKTLLLSRFSQ